MKKPPRSSPACSTESPRRGLSDAGILSPHARVFSLIAAQPICPARRQGSTAFDFARRLAGNGESRHSKIHRHSVAAEKVPWDKVEILISPT
jgi:hypothetical protein